MKYFFISSKITKFDLGFEDNLLLIQNIMDFELTQEIDRLNNEVDTLRSQVTFWEEKSDHRKERIKELKQFHEWNKSAALKWNEEKQKNEKLKKENAELKSGLVSGDLNLCSGEGIEMFHKLKADIEKLKSKDKIASGVIGRLNERERELRKENEKLKEWAINTLNMTGGWTPTEEEAEEQGICPFNCIVGRLVHQQEEIGELSDKYEKLINKI